MKTLFLTLICLFFHYTLCTEQKGVINIPITDLIGHQITTLIPNAPAKESYGAIAFCGTNTNSALACPRLHQLLYNDIVNIIKIVDDEALIHIPQAYYLIPSTSQPQTHYWTLKNNITLLDDLTKNLINTCHIPDPINFSDKHNPDMNNPNIVTLTEPHYDSTLQSTFSAGTRFVKTNSPHKKKASTISVYAINYAQMKEHIIKIPYNKCILDNNTKTPQKRITDYVGLLQKWVHQKQGCIPYTWGGTSFARTVHGNFKEITKTGHNGDYTFFEYEKNTFSPKSGFDCSGLILRAAQICGIPYFCKNTTTIAQCLTLLTTEEQLQPGDLILIKGHVMVVADITKNTLIEARSYGHGYGKLHEIPIKHVFEGVETYQDLCDIYYEKKIIKRKDKEGKVRDSFSNLQLFPMMSAWKN